MSQNNTQTEQSTQAKVSVGWSVFGFLLLAMAPISYLLGFHESIVTELAPEITLARPEWINLLWAIPGIALLTQQRQQARLQKLQDAFAAHLLPKMTPSVSPGRRRLKGILLALAWCMLVLTLAGPQWGLQVRILQRKGIDIVVAIDLSESMLAKDVTNASGRMMRRLRLARKKVQVLMESLKGERIGIIAFAGKPITLCPLTIDHNTCAIWLNSFAPSLIAQGGTALASTIKHSIPMFSTSGANSRALFILTDGDDHEKNTKKAAKEAKQKGIRIYTLGFGSTKMTVIQPNQLPPPPKGEPVDPRPIRTRLNEKLLKAISAQTLGIYKKATISHLDIRGIVEHARQTLRAQTNKSQKVEFREERFGVFMGIGMILLLFHWGIGERKKT